MESRYEKRPLLSTYFFMVTLVVYALLHSFVSLDKLVTAVQCTGTYPKTAWGSIRVCLRCEFQIGHSNYSTCPIMTRGLYTYYSIFKTISLFSRRFFSKNYFLIYGQYLREGCNQEQIIIAHIRCISTPLTNNQK